VNRLARVLLALAGLLLTACLAIVLWFSLADFSGYRARLEAAVAQKTGREFHISGEFGLKLFPAVSLTAADVTLANADWGRPGPMLTAGRFTADIGLWSLVSGPMRFKALELRDVDYLLERNQAGETNWPLPKGGPKVFESAQISNLRLTRREPDKADFTLVLDSLDLRTDAKGYMDVAAEGELKEVPFSLNGLISPRNPSAPGRYLQLDASVPLDRLGAALDLPHKLPAGDLRLQGQIAAGEAGYEFHDLAASAPGVEAQLSGVVGRKPATPTQLEFTIVAPKLSEIDARLPPIPLATNATATVSSGQIDLQNLVLHLGESDFEGSATVQLGATPSLTARGKSAVIDVTPFWHAVTKGSDAQDSPTAIGNTAGKEEAAKRKWVFSEQELPFAKLARLAADIDWSVGEVRLGELRSGKLSATLKAGAGSVTYRSSYVGFYGGTGSTDLTLTDVAGKPQLSMNLDLRDVRLNIASGDIEDPEQIPPIGLLAKLHANGSSRRALAASASGRVVFTAGAGLIRNQALVRVLTYDILDQLFHALNPFAEKEEYSALDCVVLAVDIENGMAKLDPIMTQGKRLLVLGRGTIDLRTEQLDILYNTKPRSGIGLSADQFVTPFTKLSGTMAHPRLAVSAKGALLSGGAAALTGGISLLLEGLWDRITAQGDSCPKALAAVGRPPEAKAKR